MAGDATTIDPAVRDDGRAWAQDIADALAAGGLPVPDQSWALDEEGHPELTLRWWFTLPVCNLTVYRVYEGLVPRDVRAFRDSAGPELAHGWTTLDTQPASVLQLVRALAAEGPESAG